MQVYHNGGRRTDKTLTISPSITLPAACNGKNKDIEYKLVGAWIEERLIHKKAGPTRGTPDKLEATTYFRWKNKWYRLTSSNPTPQTVPEEEIRETGKPTEYEYATRYNYLYTIHNSTP